MSTQFPNLEIDPQEPGRGAWKQDGGLLPLTPGAKVGPKQRGFYRRNAEGEAMIGSAGRAATATYGERCVWYAVQEFQKRLGLIPDGLFGPVTESATLIYQREHPETGAPDGIIGPATAKAMFAPVIRSVASTFGLSPVVLGGSAMWESGLDPAAVGVNGLDTGLVQINMGAHMLVFMKDACNAQFSIDFAARDMNDVMVKWRGKTKVNLETIAIANHNSPALAKEWAMTGKPPFSESRAAKGFPQIDEYVASVRAAGEAFK